VGKVESIPSVELLKCPSFQTLDLDRKVLKEQTLQHICTEIWRRRKKVL
jgi:hypothetical protein